MKFTYLYKGVIAVAICTVVIVLKQPAYLWALMILIFI